MVVAPAIGTPQQASPPSSRPITHGTDLWRRRPAPKHRTCTELRRARQERPCPSSLAAAGGAPVVLAPAHRIDHNTRPKTALPPAQLAASSRIALLNRRKLARATDQQDKYDAWAAAHPKQPARPAWPEPSGPAPSQPARLVPKPAAVRPKSAGQHPKKTAPAMVGRSSLTTPAAKQTGGKTGRLMRASSKRESEDARLVLNPNQVEHGRNNYKTSLGVIRSRDSSFTDYQLYFVLCDQLENRPADSPGDNDPVYSCFTRSKQFDPNTWLAKDSPFRQDRGHPPAPRLTPAPVDDSGSDYSEFVPDDSMLDDDPDVLQMPEGTSWVPAPGSGTGLVEPLTAADEPVEPSPNRARFGMRPTSAVEGNRSRVLLPPGPLWKRQRPGTAQVRSGAWQNINSKAESPVPREL